MSDKFVRGANVITTYRPDMDFPPVGTEAVIVRVNPEQEQYLLNCGKHGQHWYSEDEFELASEE